MATGWMSARPQILSAAAVAAGWSGWLWWRLAAGGIGAPPGRAMLSIAIIETVLVVLTSFACAFDDTARGWMAATRGLLCGGIVALLAVAGVTLAGGASAESVGSFLRAQVGVVSAGWLAASVGAGLGASRQSAGRLIAGLAVLGAWLGLSVLAGPHVVALVGDPQLRGAVVAADPLVTIGRLMGVDYLRGERLYWLTPLASHRFAVWPAWVGPLLFLLTGWGWLEAARLARRAPRVPEPKDKRGVAHETAW